MNFAATPMPTLSTTTATTTSPPTSPTRTSRLRGLSYLRNYTQNLHGRSDSDGSSRGTRPAFPRARSQPSPESGRAEQAQPGSARAAPQAQAQAAAAAQGQGPQRRAPSPPSNNSNTAAGQTHTNGWVPSGNTSDGTNTTRIRQQSTSEATPSSGPAPAVTTSESTPARPMTRSRADTAGPVLAVRNPSSTGPARSNSADANDAANGKNNPLPSIRFIPHFDPRANRPSLSFPAVTRTLPNPTALIKVGRYSERETPEHPTPSHAPPSSAPIGFKSKVVSRRHCEFWCQNSQWYIKDVKSSSGTFLNHVRLSPPGQESRAFAVNDGDVVQLGIDFRGGEEMIFRCVKIRVEVNRGWQKGLNEFNKKTHKQLLARQKKPKNPVDATAAAAGSTRDSDTASVNSSECSICLMSIAPCQSLFVAPCSHVWHYKCIRPILNGHTWPNFLCPNCRAVADLEADVDEDLGDEDEEEWTEEDGVAEAIEESSRRGEEAGDAGVGSSRGGQGQGQEEDGLRTPRAMQPVHMNAADGTSNSGGGVDDELSSLALASLSLTETTTHTDSVSTDGVDGLSESSRGEEDEHPTQVEVDSSSVPPRDIPTPGGGGDGTRRYELTPGDLQTEAIMTPRNDVGPFVLDGGANRGSTGAGNAQGQRSLDAAATGAASGS